MRRIRTASAYAATFESLRSLLSSHRAITRVSLTAVSFTLVIAFSHQATTQAGPEPAPLKPETLLPQNIGTAVATDQPITIAFEGAMDRASVESSLQLLPVQQFDVAWSDDGTALTVSPEGRWRSDERYLVIVGQSSTTAEGSSLIGGRRFAFTTEIAPTVTDFQVRLAAADLEPTEPVAREDVPSVRSLSASTEAIPVPVSDSKTPTQTAKQVSATTTISISFSDEMDAADVEERFAISPSVPGDLSWRGNDLVFTPTDRLQAGGRYTISLIGAHDAGGNVLGGKSNFTFIVTPGAQLVTTDPGLGARDVQPAIVEMWFSQPMDVDASNAAFALTDGSTGQLVGGRLVWNDAATQVIYTPDQPFAPGRSFDVALGDGARDVDGNAVPVLWHFSTPAAPAAAATVRSGVSSRGAPAIPPPAPAADAAGYAVNQINAARAAYGFGPVVLDAAISAVAFGHAYDQAVNNYFSHIGLDGSTRETRLRAGGVSFGWSGENQCYLVGRSVTDTLDWCHAQFMAEPYPGLFNHIANVLNPNAHRVGVGIAQVGGKIVIVWDFTD